MELRQLRYFAAVAEHRHFTRASEALNVSQPALSQQILGLERELGLPLFDRLGRGIELTAAGRVFEEHARRTLREADNARAAMDDLRDSVRGEITIAAIQTAGAGFLVDAVARFRREFPGVIVRLREERAADVAQLVQEGRANLGVTYLPLTESDGFETERLTVEELVLVVPKGHELAGRRVQTRRIGALPLVVPPGGYCLRGGIDAVLAEAGATSVAAEIAAIEGICDAVRAGVGVGILPASYIKSRAGRLGLAVARLVDPVPRRDVGVVRSAERHACAATRAFLGELRQAAEPRLPRVSRD